MSRGPRSDGTEEPIAGRPRMAPGYGVDPSVTGGVLAWSTVQERLARSRNYWVATTRPDGRPHVMPVWGLWWDEAIYFSSDPDSVKGRNLVSEPYAVVHLESGDDVTILEGVIHRVAYGPHLEPLVDAYAEKYAVRVNFTDPAYGLYRLRPSVAFAWREANFPESATRWRWDVPADSR